MQTTDWNSCFTFVVSSAQALKENGATHELLASTEFGEKALAAHLGLDGVPGELVAKVKHGAVFLIQKRFAATSGGAGPSIAVKTGADVELDFSYVEETAAPAPPTKKAKKK